MSNPVFDRARVRVSFEHERAKYQTGQWIDGELVWLPPVPHLAFLTRARALLTPDHFDRFDLSAATIQETFDQDLGRFTTPKCDDDDPTQGPKIYVPGFDLARLQIDYEFGNAKYVQGDWIPGIFSFDGESLRFLTRELVPLIPNTCDRFDIDAAVLRDTFCVSMEKSIVV